MAGPDGDGAEGIALAEKLHTGVLPRCRSTHATRAAFHALNLWISPGLDRVCQIQNEGTFINFMESKHDAHIMHLFGMRQCGRVRVCMVKIENFFFCQLAIITIIIYYTLPAQTVW